MKCKHLKTKPNGLCLSCGYNTLRLTNKQLKQLEKSYKQLEELYNEIPEGTGLLDIVREIVELELSIKELEKLNNQ